uniref:UDP-glucose 6-dehydrogenase n=1 Tax=Candidatus Aschnera chinzeii TaxID=1485666 RepID=A0AAT9G412_9ENTR|nr:MAG: UDP-glucose 6-dehydrogenase [Candidatus Aschnera chinzeii]
MKITVVGMGYVGLANALLLAQHNKVIAFDIDEQKISMLNNKQSPIKDQKIKNFLKKKKIYFTATTNKLIAYKDANYIIIAIPTNYDTHTKSFDTTIIKSVIDDINHINPYALIIIKSTIPIGFVAQLKQNTGYNNIIFVPEFLREGKALYDNLYPSRIIIGENSTRAVQFANLLLQGAHKKKITVLYTNNTEAEAIKLFTNAYLAMRVAYINELDSFAYKYNLNSKQIIQGISLDPRIGNYYNNPSFGYGGYCLPKDTNQLISNLKYTPNNLIKSITKSNNFRKKFIANNIIKKKPNIIGIYRLIMKNNSDNFRNSAIYSIIEEIIKFKIQIIIYEPLYINNNLSQFKIITNLKYFKQKSDIILANRITTELYDVKEKIFSRDIFGDN